MVVVVALHSRAGAGQRGGRNRVAGARVTAGKAGGGDQEGLGSAEAGLGAFGIGDAGHRERGLLGGGGAARPAPRSSGSVGSSRSSATGSGGAAVSARPA